MQKLKIILHYKTLILLLFFFLLILIRVSLIPKQSKFNLNDTIFTGRVTSITKKDDYIKITIDINGEKLSGNLYNTNIDLEYNDLVKVTGNLKEIEESGNFYSFSYKEYAKRHKQFFSISITSIRIIEKNDNIFYKIKNSIIKRINNISSSNYLYAFVLGDTSYIDENVLESYRTNGISHLFAISGMHLSFFISFINKILKLKNRSIKFIIISFFLILYSFLVEFTPSVLRASFLYILTFFNKSPLKSLVLSFFIILLINPYNFFEIGFQFSFLMSFILIIFSKSKNTNLITFISSIPLMILYFNQINIFTPIYNLFYISYVSYIIFPLSFIVFVFPSISFIYKFFILILEKTSLLFSKIDLSIWIMREPNIIMFVILILSTGYTIYLIYKKKHLIIVFFFCFLFLYHHINVFIPENYMTILDVGQGDSLLIRSKNKTILVDTGGNYYTDIAKNKIIPYLKAMGILKINTLILTHGDYDHMGGSINLVNTFKVENVIFNNGNLNDLELELIKVLDEKNIMYYKNIKELRIDNNKLYFLNNKVYDNENDNSNVIYTELNGIKLLLMGDAGIEVEEVLIKKYNLKDIDILKVGHHGSKTSTSRNFIDKINPKYSVISVGKNNRYGHPNNEVLENLVNSTIYRTDINGSIMFKINKNKLSIKTCKT